MWLERLHPSPFCLSSHMAEVLRRQRPSAPWHPPSVSSVPPPPARCRPSGAGCERAPRSPAGGVSGRTKSMENPLEMWRNTVEILKYYGNTMEIPRKYMEILYGNTIYIYNSRNSLALICDYHWFPLTFPRPSRWFSAGCVSMTNGGVPLR